MNIALWIAICFLALEMLPEVSGQCGGACRNSMANKKCKKSYKGPNNNKCKSTAAMRKCPCFCKRCPVDGEWGTWGAWSECTDMCGGYRLRDRACDDPKPLNLGSFCAGDAEAAQQNETCMESECTTTTTTTTTSTTTTNFLDHFCKTLAESYDELCGGLGQPLPRNGEDKYIERARSALVSLFWEGSNPGPGLHVRSGNAQQHDPCHLYKDTPVCKDGEERAIMTWSEVDNTPFDLVGRGAEYAEWYGIYPALTYIIYIKASKPSWEYYSNAKVRIEGKNDLLTEETASGGNQGSYWVVGCLKQSTTAIEDSFIKINQFMENEPDLSLCNASQRHLRA